MTLRNIAAYFFIVWLAICSFDPVMADFVFKFFAEPETEDIPRSICRVGY